MAESNLEQNNNSVAEGASAKVENIASAGRAARDEEAAAGREPTSDASRDWARLKQMAFWHGTGVIAAFTLFGAAHSWAALSGWPLAVVVSFAAAVVAGMALSSLFHEWGHFSGARLSGAVSPVLKKPHKLFFMFRFDMAANSVRQALWMSWGGLSGSWGLVALVALLVPMDSWASAALLATVFGRAVNASSFEVPIILRTRRSGEFEQELNAQLNGPGIVQVPGLIAGLAALAVLT
ncbi:MAG: hypothetical protein AAGE43_10785 [Pseudomonadota bacterium]